MNNQNPQGGTPPPPPPPPPPPNGQSPFGGSPMPPFPGDPFQAPYNPGGAEPAGPAGGYNPFGGYGPTYGGTPPPPPPPEDKTPANFQLAALLPAKLNVPVPKHNLNFNEQYFIRLLAGSISLMKDEKIRIIDSIPKLRQQQIDELIRIFEEEKRKFAELPKKHTPQLEKLAKKHYEDWMDIEMHYQKTAKKAEDNAKADEIRRKLGL